VVYPRPVDSDASEMAPECAYFISGPMGPGKCPGCTWGHFWRKADSILAVARIALDSGLDSLKMSLSVEDAGGTSRLAI
jgi:hypothetical protein